MFIAEQLFYIFTEIVWELCKCGAILASLDKNGARATGWLNAITNECCGLAVFTFSIRLTNINMSTVKREQHLATQHMPFNRNTHK